MLGIAIHCIQHSQAMMERGVCDLAHSFFHYFIHSLKTSGAFIYLKVLLEYILGSPLERHPWKRLSLETVAPLKGHERQWKVSSYYTNYYVGNRRLEAD